MKISLKSIVIVSALVFALGSFWAITNAAKGFAGDIVEIRNSSWGTLPQEVEDMK